MNRGYGTVSVLIFALGHRKYFFSLFQHLPLKMVISGIAMNTGKTLNANLLKHEIIPQGTLAADSQ